MPHSNWSKERCITLPLLIMCVVSFSYSFCCETSVLMGTPSSIAIFVMDVALLDQTDKPLPCNGAWAKSLLNLCPWDLRGHTWALHALLHSMWQKGTHFLALGIKTKIFRVHTCCICTYQWQWQQLVCCEFKTTEVWYHPCTLHCLCHTLRVPVPPHYQPHLDLDYTTHREAPEPLLTTYHTIFITIWENKDEGYTVLVSP